MDKVTLKDDIKVFCVTAESFPHGVMAAHKKIHSLVPFTEDRRYFGISWPEKGVIVYKAAAEEKTPGEGEKLGCETFIIKNGQYISVTINGFKKDIQNIANTFKKMLEHPDLDPNGCCVEWYLNDKDVKCLVRLRD
jgi:hypothetical protein